MRKILLLVLVVLGLLSVAGSALAGVDDRWFGTHPMTTPAAIMPGGGEVPD